MAKRGKIGHVSLSLVDRRPLKYRAFRCIEVAGRLLRRYHPLLYHRRIRFPRPTILDSRGRRLPNTSDRLPNQRKSHQRQKQAEAIAPLDPRSRSLSQHHGHHRQGLTQTTLPAGTNKHTRGKQVVG